MTAILRKRPVWIDILLSKGVVYYEKGPMRSIQILILTKTRESKNSSVVPMWKPVRAMRNKGGGKESLFNRNESVNDSDYSRFRLL